MFKLYEMASISTKKTGLPLKTYVSTKGQYTLDKELREVDKCILVCVNCHHELHYNAGVSPHSDKV